MAKVGSELLVRGIGLDDRGQCEAMVETTPPSPRCFVSDLFPGELARIRVEHVSRAKKHGAPLFGRVLKLVEPHPSRREHPCPNAGEQGCSGCPLGSIDESAELDMKVARAEQVLGRTVSLMKEAQLPSWGYRWSAKRVVGGVAGDLKLGSYRRRTHDVVSMRGCLVDDPAIAKAADEIEQKASELEIEPWDEPSQSGDLRYVWLKTDGRGNVLSTLITGTSDSRAPELAGRLECSAGVAWQVQGSTGNAIRSDAATAKVLCGVDAIELELMGARRRQGPLAFMQPNPRVAAQAYAALLADVGTGPLAYDLYAGAGVTTELLRERYETVIPCESFPPAAEMLGVKPQTAAAFLRGRLTQPAPSLITANPPRAGLGETVCELLTQRRAPSLRIMSCDASSMARDLDALSSAYKVARVDIFDTLPQTPHVELVARLERRS